MKPENTTLFDRWDRRGIIFSLTSLIVTQSRCTYAGLDNQSGDFGRELKGRILVSCWAKTCTIRGCEMVLMVCKGFEQNSRPRD